tara:strand:+ start:1144 stop:2436 length:1293 start_codon:yes stop_codon:yes gene_type:complete
MHKHQRIVEHNISKLSEFHEKNINFDFKNVNLKLLHEILKHAKNNVPYYDKIISDGDINSPDIFENIPILTKQLIRENIDTLKSTNVPESFLLARKTGGSTGEPLSFWSSGDTEMLHQTFLYKLNGYKLGDKILVMDGTKINEDLLIKNIFWSQKNNGNMLPFGGMVLSSLYLNKNNIKIYLDFLISYKPEFIRGYPAFIYDIANFIIENKIDIGFELKAIELTSELCLDYQIIAIEKGFDTKVIGQYGHTEACVFGYTIDSSFEYYCSPLYGAVEVLDENNNQVKEGEEGEIISTSFSNFAFPLIRYRTGDRAIFGGCSNGIVKLKKVLGRTADFIINKDNDKVLLTALIFGQHFNAFAKIIKWQIIQNEPGIVIIKIERSLGYSKLDEDEISSTFLNSGKTYVLFEYTAEFIKTKRGKTKFVIQNILE